VAEQLLVSQEGLFSMTLFVIVCNDLAIHSVEIIQSSYSIISFVESV
jgi:uncharacterized protein (DUF2344 family)